MNYIHKTYLDKDADIVTNMKNVSCLAKTMSL